MMLFVGDPKDMRTWVHSSMITAQPIQETIDLVNDLYDDGHKIVVYTAREMSQYKGDVNLIYSNFMERYHNLINGVLSR